MTGAEGGLASRLSLLLRERCVDLVLNMMRQIGPS